MRAGFVLEMLRFGSFALLAFTLLGGDCVASSFCMLDPCFNEACYKTWRNDAAEKLHNRAITKARNVIFASLTNR